MHVRSCMGRLHAAQVVWLAACASAAAAHLRDLRRIARSLGSSGCPLLASVIVAGFDGCREGAGGAGAGAQAAAGRGRD